MNMEVGGKNKGTKIQGKQKSKSNFKIDFDFRQKLSGSERAILRTVSGVVVAFIVYIAGTNITNKAIDNKREEVQVTTTSQQQQIASIQSDKSKLDEKTNDYSKMISNLETINETIASNSKYKNALPTLLNQIMFVIPKNVQLTSIKNTEGTHIVINAEAKQYEQLGYFKGILKTENILSNVVSDSSVKENGIIKVTIEGDIV